MKDLAIRLINRPGSLAEIGEALALAQVSIEGGGVWMTSEQEGIAHFLFKDATAARNALEAKGIEVLKENDVLIQKLDQDQFGQLGEITRRMQQAGVNIEVQYSDHHNRLILVVDDFDKGRAVSAQWTAEHD